MVMLLKMLELGEIDSDDCGVLVLLVMMVVILMLMVKVLVMLMVVVMVLGMAMIILAKINLAEPPPSNFDRGLASTFE